MSIEDRKRRDSDSQNRWRRTKRGVLSTIYHSELRRSTLEGWPKPDYDLAYLLERFLDDPAFNALYDAWVAAGHPKMLKPSLDRINASLPYLRTNIQIMTFEDNLRKAVSMEYARTEVVMCDRDGKELRQFSSMTEAADYVGGTVSKIARACRDQNYTHCGYRWKYGERRKYKSRTYRVKPKDSGKQFRDDVVDYWHSNPSLSANQVAEKFGVEHPLAIYNWKYFTRCAPFEVAII
jgi:hypothetical protein